MYDAEKYDIDLYTVLPSIYIYIYSSERDDKEGCLSIAKKSFMRIEGNWGWKVDKYFLKASGDEEQVIKKRATN